MLQMRFFSYNQELRINSELNLSKLIPLQVLMCNKKKTSKLEVQFFFNTFLLLNGME